MVWGRFGKRTRRYRRGYIEVPKKNGKSTIFAGLSELEPLEILQFGQGLQFAHGRAFESPPAFIKKPL